jgi:hypothetical protein
MDTLDFAIRQSSNSYLSDIAGKRPWSVVAPVLFQYESNVLGLDDDSALPEGFKRREGGKVVYGLFGNYSGLGGDHQGRGPWGFALRLIASQAVDKEFQGLNLLYSEAEATWSARSAGKNTITVSPSAYTVRVGGKSLNHAVQLKSSFNQNDFSAGFEFDAARNSDTDRSVWVAGIARNFEILQGEAFAVVHPTELGARIPTSKEKGGEFKTEITLSPGVNWYPSKRVSISLNDRFSFSRISANTARYNLLKNKVGLKSTWSFQPYLTLGASYEFELSKQTHSSTLTRKSTATLSVLGLF